jgi:hypothetical protein
MTKLQLEQLAFLVETATHFNINNRGHDKINGGCSYLLGCAIGRKIEDKDLCRTLDTMTVQGRSFSAVFEKMPPFFQSLGIGAVRATQHLHDEIDNWDENGLSPRGLAFFEGLLNRLKNNEFAFDNSLHA